MASPSVTGGPKGAPNSVPKQPQGGPVCPKGVWRRPMHLPKFAPNTAMGVHPQPEQTEGCPEAKRYPNAALTSSSNKNVDSPSTLHIARLTHELRQPGEKADSEGLMLSGNSGTLTDGAMTSPDSGASCLAQPGSAPHLLSMLRPDRRRRKRRRHPNRWQQRKPRRGIRQHILRIGDELADVAS